MRAISFVLGCILSVSVFAEVSPEVKGKIEKAFKSSLPSLSIDNIQKSPIHNLYEITSGPVIIYATEDGKFAISGDILDLSDGETNITENARKSARLNALKLLGEDNMVVYAAEKPRHEITVFTDIDCTYCRKFHAQMEEMNKKGISVRYLAFPRTGTKSTSFEKAVHVWCSDDKKAAMDEAKAGKKPDIALCEQNKVADMFHLGVMAGVTGTPTVILQDGTMVPGYYDPQALMQVLKQTKQPSLN